MQVQKATIYKVGFVRGEEERKERIVHHRERQLAGVKKEELSFLRPLS